MYLLYETLNKTLNIILNKLLNNNKITGKRWKIKMVKCEYCGENEAVFSIEVNSPNGDCEESNEVCPECVAIWFTETPEDVERMSIVRLEEE